MSIVDMATLQTLSRGLGRRPTASVNITWGGGSVDSATATVSLPKNRVSIEKQVIKYIGQQRKWAFCDTDSATSKAMLDGNWCAMPTANSDGSYHGSHVVGWWGISLSNSAGVFTAEQRLTVDFPTQTLRGVRLAGYLWRGEQYAEWPVDFTAEAHGKDGNDYVLLDTISVSGNASVICRASFAEAVYGATRLIFKITKWSHPLAFVKITAAFDDYMGEYGTNEIMSMSILEETDGAVGTLPVGNISANELTLTLQNITDNFFIGNPTAEVGSMMRKGRRVEPSVGFIGDGEPPDNAMILWDDTEMWNDNGIWLDYPPSAPLMIPKGVYWTQTWDASEDSTGATTTAVDRLGLLRDIEYNGIGNIDNPEGIAEETVRNDISLYDLTEEILMDLRINYMPDLEWDIDQDLGNDIIPVAFFKRQSYFDVIKTIAQAAVAFAYMDAPNEAEYNAAVARGNDNCADILRIKKLENFAPDAGVVNESITGKDILGKNIRVLPETVVNYITVPYNIYEADVNSGKIVHIEGDGGAIIGVADGSILEYGKSAHEFDGNTLIQTPEHAEKIVTAILDAFAGAPRVAEVSSFGDVTRSVGDIIDLPEYAKRGVEAHGRYIITRIQTEFDGGIRQTLTCRRALDAPIERGDG